MMTNNHGRPCAPIDINHLRRGRSYRAHSRTGQTVTGEYLGIEVAYDEWRILLRCDHSVESLAIHRLDSVLAVAS